MKSYCRVQEIFLLQFTVNLTINLLVRMKFNRCKNGVSLHKTLIFSIIFEDIYVTTLKRWLDSNSNAWLWKLLMFFRYLGKDNNSLWISEWFCLASVTVIVFQYLTNSFKNQIRSDLCYCPCLQNKHLLRFTSHKKENFMFAFQCIQVSEKSVSIEKQT